MTNEPKPAFYRPEFYLFASHFVDDVVRREPSDFGDFFSLRLDPTFPLARLAKAVDGNNVTVDDIFCDVHGLLCAGWRTIHVVHDFSPERAVPLIRELRRLASDGVDIQLHDWYTSPTSVVANLNTPDLEVSVALRKARGDMGGLLKLAAEPVLPLGFRERLIMALRLWEEESRSIHGPRAFGAMYGKEPIAWTEVIAE